MGCADLLFQRFMMCIDKDTFITLAQIASCNVLMSTCDGYYIQKDGLAMGSPCAPLLANGWLSQFDRDIKGDAKIYFRYMDDIFRNIVANKLVDKLEEINSYHDSLTFTHEKEKENELPMLDMSVKHNEDGTSTTPSCGRPLRPQKSPAINVHMPAPPPQNKVKNDNFIRYFLIQF